MITAIYIVNVIYRCFLQRLCTYFGGAADDQNGSRYRYEVHRWSHPYRQWNGRLLPELTHVLANHEMSGQQYWTDSAIPGHLFSGDVRVQS